MEAHQENRSPTHQPMLDTQGVHLEKKTVKSVPSLPIIKWDTQGVHLEKKTVKSVPSLPIIKWDT